MSVVREMLAAGPGCALANGMLNGLETTKVKLQLHNHSSPVYHNLTTTGVMRQIIREEGIVRGLMMPGLSASLTRSMFYGAYRVGLYSTTRDWLASNNTNSAPTLINRIGSGVFTGGLGAMLTCPLDVVRTRMQADAGLVRQGIYQTGLRKGQPVRYGNLLTAFLSIFRQEGLQKGLYRGASVTVTRASLLNGSQLASYDTLKKTLGWEEGPFLHVFCAFLSGIIAQTVVMPIDTIKSSMMIGNCPKGVWKTMMENGGLFWFYRGYIPACAGQGMIMVLQMPLIEQFRGMLGVDAI
mmetsp:Transcript_10389/g.18237  ORF Transcript_10389/g.18237 Transcript_10389/m.18237 type:complete len:296 (-) Transcript_10389:1318-2205(-)|eukprot:CAMPEP_0183757242 /NCGR_PEP_ID=MMETSP0739-20130205/5606_1 /TAXON_ID=385413 /ORGANISM="Thalassiosira miniscula, Strain CCMP1093" /LENGTH=295 /DNA_ID=CAMNT_0025994635 /DNA_START=451 /DNA_END=1338 /DNA_ORIENTATION=+